MFMGIHRVLQRLFFSCSCKLLRDTSGSLKWRVCRSTSAVESLARPCKLLSLLIVLSCLEMDLWWLKLFGFIYEKATPEHAEAISQSRVLIA